MAQNTTVVKAPLYTDQMAISTTSVTGVRIARSALAGKRSLVFIATADCNVKFGLQGMAAATSADTLYKANTQYRVTIDSGTTYFSVLGAGSGTFTWYLEGVTGLESAAGILGSLFVDEWTRESNASATAWTSRVVRTITNSGAVTYAADGSNFNGGKVIGTTQGSTSMSGSGLTSLAASGSLPYVACVARDTGLGGNQVIFSVGITNDQLLVGMGGGVFSAKLVGGLALAVGQATDTLPHFFEVWADGTNFNFAIDGTLVQTASTQKINENLTKFVVGDSIASPGAQSNAAHSRYIFASAPPSAAQRAQLLALVKQLDGF